MKVFQKVAPHVLQRRMLRIPVALFSAVTDQSHDRGNGAKTVVCQRHGIELKDAVQEPKDTPKYGELTQAFFARLAIGDHGKDAREERKNILPSLKAQKRKARDQNEEKSDAQGARCPLPLLFP